ncbi:MAG: hypothetical protein LUG56_01420, partial [Lachnospiraceae bacterium]|nr:hypothetical protein [Lachnospiraceae bacterium]
MSFPYQNPPYSFDIRLSLTDWFCVYNIPITVDTQMSGQVPVFFDIFTITQIRGKRKVILPVRLRLFFLPLSLSRDL